MAIFVLKECLHTMLLVVCVWVREDVHHSPPVKCGGPSSIASDSPSLPAPPELPRSPGPRPHDGSGPTGTPATARYTDLSPTGTWVSFNNLLKF